MTFDELNALEKIEAVKMVVPENVELKEKDLHKFPDDPAVIVYVGNYSESDDQFCEFIEKFDTPDSEIDVQNFLEVISKKIVKDPILSDKETIKNVDITYSIVFDQYNRLIRRSPDSLHDWAEAKGTFLWYDSILPKRRHKQFLKIKKVQDNEAMEDISSKIKKIYGFADLEITYLQYFCSQSKLDDLDPSLNTMLYLWSKEQYTGKTTVASYICAFLNGENSRDVDAHKSDLNTELQMDRFDIPNAVSSQCTLIDEGGFYDMSKTYESFKQMITSNSCKIEFKYKSSKRNKSCHRNYIMTSNIDPIRFVKDETERRLLALHFKRPEDIGFTELEKLWKKFVYECNLSAIKLESIYKEVIRPNAQVGEVSHIMIELADILTETKINNCVPITQASFSISNVQTISEVYILKDKFTRNVIKEVLIKLYGEPDKQQRFYKSRRGINGFGKISDEELPF